MVGKHLTTVRVSLISGILGAALLVGGCSPNIFSPSLDQLTTPNYRPLNTACGIHSTSTTLDAPTFRALIHCFNSYGALQPFDDLTAKLSDEELQPVVDAILRYVLDQPQILYELDQSYQSLDGGGKLTGEYQSLGKLLENDEFIVSAVVLLKDAYYQPQNSLLRLFSTPKADPQVLAALNYLSQKVTAENTATGIDVGITGTTAPPFYSIQKKFRPAGRNLRDLTDAALSYVQDSNPNRVPVGQRFIEGLIRGDLFRAVDEAIGGSTAQSLQSGTDRLAAVFRETFSDNAGMFEGITSLFSSLHVPIHCMKGTQVVPDADMFFMREISRQNSNEASGYMRITYPLTQIAVNPFCDSPPELATYYPYVIQLAQSTAVEPSVDLLKAFYRPEMTDPIGGIKRPLAELMIDMLAEGSIKNLAPVMAELNDRKVWDDLMLMATLPKEEDRDAIANALTFITQPIPGQGPTSLYEVALNSIQKIDPADFYRFVASLKGFTDRDDSQFLPFLWAMRDTYYVNNVHPFQALIQEFLKDAPKNQKLFDVLFKTSGMKEFQNSVKLMSTLAKDGRLKQLLETTLAIYRPISQSGHVAISPVTQPGFVPKSRHNLDESDLTPFELRDDGSHSADPCAHLNLRFGVDQFDTSDYDENFDYTLRCLTRDPQDKPLADAVNYLRTEKSETNGWDFFRLPVEMMKQWDPSRSELEYLSNAWLRTYDSGYFLNLLDTVPYFINRTIAPQAGGDVFDPGNVVRPLIDLAEPLVQDSSRPSLKTIETFAAGELKREDFPKTLKFADDLMKRDPEPTYTPIVSLFDRERLKRWVTNKECMFPDSKDSEIRATQILDDFDNALDNWSLQKGQPRRSYTLGDFKVMLAPTMEKLAKPELNALDKPLIESLLELMTYFTMDSGHKINQHQHLSTDDFLKWVEDRASDYKLITFYYKDETGRYEEYPRVRLVNSLDRMELVLIESDFQVNLLGLQLAGNSSLQYSAELAQAWGDEPRDIWPDQIKSLYPPGSKVQKIADVVQDMYNSAGMFDDLIGFPTLPNCKQTSDPNDPPDVQKQEATWPKNKSGIHLPETGPLRDIERNLYNLNQVLSVLGESKPEGLKILRDLMFELYFSTPPKWRSYTLKYEDEWHNNLKIADDLSRLGFFRGLGQLVRRFKGDEKELHDAFHTFLTAATVPQAREAMYTIFAGNPNQEVFWATLQKIFNVFATAEGRFTPEQEKQLSALSEARADEQKQEWVREAARMKQLGLYSLALGDPEKLTGPLLGALTVAVKDHSDFLVKHSDEIESMLRSARASYATRALYEEPDAENRERVARILRTALSDPKMVDSILNLLEAVDENAASKNAWSLFSSRKDALFALPEFQPYRQYFDRFDDDLIWFFADQGSDPEALQASAHLRQYAAELLENGELEQFLLLAKKDPNKFYQVLQTLSAYVENGQLKQFFDLVRRSISDAER